MNFAPESYVELFDREQRQGVKNCLILLDWLARLPDPEAKILYGAFWERISQPPGDKKTLEHILGMDSTGPGQLSPFTAIRNSIRNYHLKKAMEHLQKEHSCKAWPACKRLAESIQAFYPIKFKRLQAGSRAIADELEQHLFAAFVIDTNPPATQSYLHDILINSKE